MKVPWRAIWLTLAVHLGTACELSTGARSVVFAIHGQGNVRSHSDPTFLDLTCTSTGCTGRAGGKVTGGTFEIVATPAAGFAFLSVGCDNGTAYVPLTGTAGVAQPATGNINPDAGAATCSVHFLPLAGPALDANSDAPGQGDLSEGDASGSSPDADGHGNTELLDTAAPDASIPDTAAPDATIPDAATLDTVAADANDTSMDGQDAKADSDVPLDSGQPKFGYLPTACYPATGNPDCNNNGVGDTCDLEPAMTVVHQSTAGGAYTDLATADVDGDGDLDIVTFAKGKGAWLANTGAGSFAAAATFALDDGKSFATQVLCTADLDADGKADFVVQTSGESAVRIYHGNGDGTLKWLSTLTTKGIAGAPVVAHWNGDGLPDLVVPVYVPSALEVFVHEGDPKTGQFVATAGVGLPCSDNAKSVLVGSLDGAQGDDFFVLGSNGKWCVAPNVGGVAGPALLAPWGSGPPRLGLFDAGTLLDAWSAGGVWFGDGKGKFAQGPQSPIAGVVGAFDFDNDGDSDLLAAAGKVEVQDNQGKGQFSARLTGIQIPAGFGVWAVRFGDLDGDGLSDAALTQDDFNGGKGLVVLRNKGYGGLADANQDGKPDICK